MDSSQFLETVLRPVTAFLDEALGRSGAHQTLERTAEPLIRAIEAVPESGRVAVFLNEEAISPEFVSGPSFEPEEIDALRALVAEHSGESLDTPPPAAILPIASPGANRVRLFPLRVPSERPTAILVTVRDPLNDDDHSVFDDFMDQIARLAGIVVEDRRLRARMAEQQSVLEALVGAAPDAIVRMDRGGVVLDFMGSAPRVFGWAPEEIIGQDVTILMPEAYAADHDKYVEAFLATGERKLPDFGRRLQAKHKSGRVFPVEIALSQLPGRGDVEFIGIVRDISKRVEREREMDAMREALDAAGLQSALGEFAATIAHELNQPLTAIANYMDALELRLSDPAEPDLEIARDLSKKAAAQARLGGEIIRRTRRMAVSGESEMHMDRFHAAIVEALSIVSKTTSAANVEIRTVAEGPDLESLFDRVQIQQVLINLTSNALRAMKNVEPRTLTVITRQSDERLQLVVRDTGNGVSDEDKQKIFNRFFRRSDNGMGLGLSVVRGIALAHGGDVSVRDAPGGGAEFILSLPRRVVDAGQA